MTEGDHVRIVCQQLAPDIADLAANETRSAAAIGEAVRLGADLVVLPELVTSGYVFSSREEAASVAITPTDLLFRTWAAAAGDATVVAGFCELGTDGNLYNSAAVVDAGGVIAVYRKTHLWDREKLVFTPGDEPPPVLDTPHGRVGVLVCYDLEFPEVTRSLALRGADLLVVPTNWPLVPRPDGERPPEVLIAMAAARVNRMFVACCDRVGTERGQAWTGGSSIIDEQGWVAAASGAAGPVIADVDLGRARAKTLGPHSDAFSDRRPELYGPLTAVEATAAAGPAVREFASFEPTPVQQPFVVGAEPGRPSDDPVVLLPGMLGDAEVWADVATLLADRRSVQVGRIDVDDSVAEAAASVLAAAPPRFALAGHSLGGIVALEIVRQAPERVSRLALLNTSARAGSDAQQGAWAELRRRVEEGDFRAVAEELARATLPEQRREDVELVDRLERSAAVVGADGLLRQLDAQSTRPDSRPFLRGIRVPTIVVTGDDDQVCPPELQDELAAGIPGAVHRTLDGVGHMAPIEAPAVVAEVLVTWLR